MVKGNYIGSGIPYDFFVKRARFDRDTVLNRGGINDPFPYSFTAFVAPNGATVVNGNCFTCHAGEINGEIQIGLGDSFSDYEKSLAAAAKVLYFGMKVKYKKKSPEFQAFEDFGRYFRDMTPHIVTNQPGVNPAFRLAEACMMHRNPVDLTYTETPNYQIID